MPNLFEVHELHWEKNQGQKCLSTGNVLELDMSQGWTCLRCFKLLLHKKSEKERLRRCKIILGQVFWTILVLGPDLSQGWTCPKTSGLDLSKSFRDGSVSQPEVFKSLGPEVSCGRTSLAARLVLELYEHVME